MIAGWSPSSTIAAASRQEARRFLAREADRDRDGDDLLVVGRVGTVVDGGPQAGLVVLVVAGRVVVGGLDLQDDGG